MPTRAITGLHAKDIKKLLAILQKLVNRGNTVVEHNLDVIKSADWIIALGPENGAAVAEGRPEQVAKVAASYTRRFLADALMLAAHNSCCPLSPFAQ